MKSNIGKKIKLYSSIRIFVYVCVVLGNQTQGFAHGRPALYHWAIAPRNIIF